MAEPWRPLVELLESFSALRTLASPDRDGAPAGGPDADAVAAAVGRFRDALVAAFEVELLPVRLHHRGRGGFVDRVIPRPHATRAASHSDEARDLAEEQLSRMFHLTGEYYLGYPELLEPEAVARQWADVADELASLDIPEGSPGRLAELVREEHRSASPASPARPAVYRAPGGASPGRRRGESRARKAGYEVDAGPARPRVGEAGSPTDQIFFVAGEPAERSVTKIAGLPYRAAGLPWPRADDGRPMTFLAQFCFAESRDLVGELPGDVLLVFARDEQAYLPDPYGDSLWFEWHPLGLRELVAAEAIPAAAWQLRPYFGVRHRTDDGHLAGTPGGQTKIGGEPAWIQAHGSPGGRFLCELGSWRGVPAEWDRWGSGSIGRGAGEELSMGDMGCLYFFLNADGVIRWSFQCY